MEKILRFFERIIPRPLYKACRPIYHFLLSWSGGVFYRHPSRKIFVIGVTGTKGKSTTIELLNVVLEEAGNKTALLSTVRQKIGDKTKEKTSSNTMAGRWQIQKFLHRAVKAGCSHAIIEVTSEGVSSHRHRFIGWDAAFFLNLSPEHIEAHGSFEKYREAKTSFFKYLKKSKKPLKYFVINADDIEAPHFKEVAEKTPYSRIIEFKKDGAYRLMEDLRNDQSGNVADWLRAGFNLENLSAVVSFVKFLGMNDEEIKKSLEGFPGIPGRMEFVQHEPFGVVIDYAHTSDSMQELFQSLRENYLGNEPAKGKLICVFGATGGGRDKWKRPEMGKVAEKYCDIIVLTSDDTYDEDPNKIISDIKSGISGSRPSDGVYEIADREEAVNKAMELARPGDVVALLGIGSQKYINTAKGRETWSEKETAKEALKGIGEKTLL